MSSKLLYLFKRYQALGLVCMTGITLSAITSFMVYRSEVEKDRARFQQQITVLEGELQGQLDSYTQLTRSMGFFFNTADRMRIGITHRIR